MKYRIVPIVIVVLIIFVGHILKRIHISKLRERGPMSRFSTS